MRKVIIVLLLLFSFEAKLFAGDWECVNEYIVPLILDADKSEIGQVIYRDYVNENKSAQVIITKGKASGNLYIPDEINNNKGVMPCDDIYKILDIDGHKSILEKHEYMPLVLAVNADENKIITIETNSLNEEEIKNFATIIITQKSIE